MKRLWAVCLLLELLKCGIRDESVTHWLMIGKEKQEDFGRIWCDKRRGGVKTIIIIIINPRDR